MRQIAVIGLGNFGSRLARELVEQGAQVIAIDKEKARVEELKEFATYSVALDATDENALRSVGIGDVDVAVVCIGVDIEANLLITLLLKRMGVPKIWSRAISPLQQEILRALEVDSIINLETEMGKLVARNLVAENVVKHVHLSPGYGVAELRVPSAFVGKTLRQINARKTYSINVIAIKKRVPQITEGGERTFQDFTENVPSPDVPLEETDVLVIVGNDKDIIRVSRA